MLNYLVPLLFTFSAVTSYQDIMPYYDVQPSAASASQIKFAEENKYDDTGPGAKKPEYAYNTYKTLDEALVAYLNDPNTVLPEHERQNAIQKLLKSSNNYGLLGQYPKSFNNPPFTFQTKHQAPPRTPIAHIDNNNYYAMGSKPLYDNKKVEPFKFQKFHVVKGSPLSLAHYTRNTDIRRPFDDFKSFPKYSYAYRAHDKSTGDLKHVQESRDGGAVRGFYSFVDANGKHHTVHYTDDGKGLRASISKYPINH